MGLLSHAGQGRFETVHEENLYEDYIRIFRDQQTGVNYLGINYVPMKIEKP
ncbi:hypothetical protein SAMN05421767_12633 [Granulicatella balaenopterae]|uniref:DUF6440 domain-containing protein n=1 Tax=Granulicatella balaenopterae TaxID=137733 RepID=A0A1H9MFD0_9LACT|nr:DUF6440 family protein [Granulicatella balaenopterae]SER22157.1 hypothetical protein SAMN05421767_12633 [Granulicatella balaenopterae]